MQERNIHIDVIVFLRDLITCFFLKKENRTKIQNKRNINNKSYLQRSVGLYSSVTYLITVSGP